jgi:Fe2+ transport system protein FeoA
VRLTALKPGGRGVVRRVLGDGDRAERLAALGLTPGAPVEVLQRFPGMVLRCEETELVVEPAVAHAILVEPA